MHVPTIGILGTGDFAAYFVAALRNGGHKGKILLSPHNLSKAASLAAAQDCIVSEDDAAMIAEADWVLLSVRPEQLPATLTKLALRPSQVLLSAVAGVTVNELRAVISADITVIRIMPSSYIGALRNGLLPMYPSCAQVEAVLSAAGKVVVFDTESHIELAMIGACLSGWMYRFTATLEGWFVEHGVTPSQARQIVAGNILGAAGNALLQTETSLEEISDGIATQGTYTKLGLDHLRNKKSFGDWTEALDLVSNKLDSADL